LTWLRDHKRKTFQEGLSINDERNEEPDWMLEYSRKQQKDDALAKRADMEARLAKIREKEIRAQQRYQAGELPNKRQVRVMLIVPRSELIETRRQHHLGRR